MAFRKTTAPVADKARLRLASLKSVEANFDFGNGLSIAAFEAKLREAEQALEFYNTQLSEADHAKNMLDNRQKELQDLSQRMLQVVGVKYGYDSSEYEKAGGTRKSDRKKPVKKKIRA